jgi:hypothetical protein
VNWGLIVYQLVAAIAILLSCCPSAHAFQNIEADKLYDTTIKQQIQDEFTQALKMLKAQADGLGMTVREKDITALQEHMYEKAILMGSCVDKGITQMKMVSDRLALDKYVSGCIKIHQQFMNSLHSIRQWPHSIQMCAIKSYIKADENRPYDFLGIKDLMLDTTDYVAMKDCVDNRSEKDKFLDR